MVVDIPPRLEGRIRGGNMPFTNRWEGLGPADRNTVCFLIHPSNLNAYLVSSSSQESIWEGNL